MVQTIRENTAIEEVQTEVVAKQGFHRKRRTVETTKYRVKMQVEFILRKIRTHSLRITSMLVS